MPVESWITPDDTPVFVAQATDRIDVVLARLGEAERAAFWASVRKCYNTPYNDPKPRLLPTTQITAPVPLPPQVQSNAQSQTIPLERPMPGRDVPMAAMPVPSFTIEAHAS